jgi:LysR family hydrogen peroxide-inducible transcriptional activator
MSIYKTNNAFERLDLSLLRYFFAVTSFGGFSKASRATGISQPALSLGLQKLEKTLGTRLIERHSGRFSLTESGRLLDSFCKRLEGGLDSLLGDLDGHPGKTTRRLRVGTALSVGFGPLLGACLNNGRADAPLELELWAQTTFQLISALKEGQLDAALVPDDVFDRSLEVTPLFKDRFVFVHAPARKASFRGKNWALEPIAEPLITYPRETPMRSLVDQICAKHQLRFKTTTSVNGLDGILGLVRHGAGGAFVLKSLVEEDLRKKDLLEAEFPFALPASGVVMVTTKDEHGREISRLLVKKLGDQL